MRLLFSRRRALACHRARPGCPHRSFAVTTNTDKPGVVIRPPLLYLGAIGIGFALDALWPLALSGPVWRLAVAPLALVSGFGLLAAAIARFRRAGTNVQTTHPAEVLVTDGPFSLSRNPIYVALTLIYCGISLAADNPWMVALLAPVLLVMRFGVVAREEAYLDRKFGERYRAYKSSVRR